MKGKKSVTSPLTGVRDFSQPVNKLVVPARGG